MHCGADAGSVIYGFSGVFFEFYGFGTADLAAAADVGLHLRCDRFAAGLFGYDGYFIYVNYRSAFLCQRAVFFRWHFDLVLVWIRLIACLALFIIFGLHGVLVLCGRVTICICRLSSFLVAPSGIGGDKKPLFVLFALALGHIGYAAVCDGYDFVGGFERY